MITKLVTLADLFKINPVPMIFMSTNLGLKYIPMPPWARECVGLQCVRRSNQRLRLHCYPITEGMMFDKDSVKQMRALVEKGTFGFGVFECHDLLATYEELKAKGVEFTKPPTKEFYGYEALFKDDSGNWFSLGQKSSRSRLTTLSGQTTLLNRNDLLHFL